MWGLEIAMLDVLVHVADVNNMLDWPALHYRSDVQLQVRVCQ